LERHNNAFDRTAGARSLAVAGQCGRWPLLRSGIRVPLPQLTEYGELPLGVHPAPLHEVLDRFGVGSDQRKALALRLMRVYRVAQASGHLARFVIFGSFVTGKIDPNDVDVFLLMADTFDVSRLSGDASLLFAHAAAQAHFGASVFWLRRLAAWPDEPRAIEFWQVKRGGGRKGIVEVMPREAS